MREDDQIAEELKKSYIDLKEQVCSLLRASHSQDSC